MPPRTFRKTGSAAPAGYFEWEAAGLRWLAGAPGGASVVAVLAVGDNHLDLERLNPAAPTRSAAETLGPALAATHAAGATAYGSPPTGWHGHGWLGPTSEPLALDLDPVATWGELWAGQRIGPMLREGLRRGTYDADAARLFERVQARVAAGMFDTDDPPARLHGDLWSGNLVWTDCGVVLIDPAAHGAHRETDLAMLSLFGAPHLEVILAAYHEAMPLAPGWRERSTLHQLHPIMLHAVLFGGRYVDQSIGVARLWL